MPRASLSDGEVYARSLLPRCRGYPLWIPEPFGAIAEYQNVGVRIGDVGYVTEDGAFETLFNVRVDANDPINKHGVPEEFEPLRLDDELHLSVVAAAVKEQSSIFSEHAKEIGVGFNVSLLDNPTLPASAGAGITVHWSSREGAIAHLPRGASHTRTPPSLFRKYALRHARSWYEFVNDVLERDIPSGSLYLITAFDKCDSWMVGAFSEAGAGHEVSLQIGAFGVGQAGVSRSYNWYNTNSPASRVGPTFPSVQSDGQESALVRTSTRVQDSKNTPLGRNQCLFIKGYNVALRKNWGFMSRKETSHVSLIENTKPDDIPRLGLQPSSLFRRGSRDDGSRSTGSRTPQTPEKDEQENEISPNTSADSVILDFIPATEVPFHPAMALNQYLLEAAPDAQVVLTHDDDWCALGKMDSGTATSAILQRYLVIDDDGAYFDEALSREDDKNKPPQDPVTAPVIDPAQTPLPETPASLFEEMQIQIIQPSPLLSWSGGNQSSRMTLLSLSTPQPSTSTADENLHTRQPYNDDPMHSPPEARRSPVSPANRSPYVPRTGFEDDAATQSPRGVQDPPYADDQDESPRRVSFNDPPVTQILSNRTVTDSSSPSNSPVRRRSSSGDLEASVPRTSSIASPWSVPSVVGTNTQLPSYWSRAESVASTGGHYPGSGNGPPLFPSAHDKSYTPRRPPHQNLESIHSTLRDDSSLHPNLPTAQPFSDHSKAPPPPPPAQGFALICGGCFAHNGLLPQSIWEATQYFCPRCNHHNALPAFPLILPHNESQTSQKPRVAESTTSTGHAYQYRTYSKPHTYDTNSSQFVPPVMNPTPGPAPAPYYQTTPAISAPGPSTPWAPTILHPMPYTPQPVYYQVAPQWGTPYAGYVPHGPTGYGAYSSQAPFIPPDVSPAFGVS